MNGAVLYRSKYGSTGQYAKWLSESLQVKLIDVKEARSTDLIPLDYLVFCSPFYYGKLLISGFIKKNRSMFKDKRVYLLVTGGTDENAKDDIKNMLNDNFDQKFFDYHINWFYSGGRIEVDKLGFLEKFLIKNMAKMVKDEKEKEKLKKGYDHIDREKLNPVIKQIIEDTK